MNFSERVFAIGGIALSHPFPRMTYAQAMDTTGSARPDLRCGRRMWIATALSDRRPIPSSASDLQRGGCIKGINIRDPSENLSRNVLQNEYAKEIAPSFAAKGMTWTRVEGGKLESNICASTVPAGIPAAAGGDLPSPGWTPVAEGACPGPGAGCPGWHSSWRHAWS